MRLRPLISGVFYFMKTQEIWKDIPNYEGLYQASNLGRIRSFYINCKILKQNIGTNGYLSVNLYKDKKHKPSMVHKLIMLTFNNIESNRKNVIDHINNIKTDNRVDNLQLVTNRYNSSKDKKSKSNHYNIMPNSNSYLIRMRINYKKHSIGTFKNIDDAIFYRDKFICEIMPKISDNHTFEQVSEIVRVYRISNNNIKRLNKMIK